jgi:hypothetical protein
MLTEAILHQVPPSPRQRQPALGLKPENLSRGPLSYELRRLRLRGLIRRLPRTHRYEITPLGRTQAVFLSRLYAHVLRPGLAELAEQRLRPQADLLRSFKRLDRSIAEQARKLAA